MAHPYSRESVEDQTLSRVKRIETRLTQLMIGLGVDTRTQHPQFDPDTRTVQLPSIHSSTKEILDSIPENCHDAVDVYLGAQRLFTLYRPE